MNASGKTYHEGIVLENLPNALFRVKLDDGRAILGHLSGKMRLHYIKVLLGDRVRVEMTQYDDTKGRIVHRLK
ncbi:MAG: translation initiation factor IF-1 [Candidatus Sungbacteria bacterium]|nr:translation initiation factor IF-1 [Candidatus Sungbacteria bacterium]